MTINKSQGQTLETVGVYVKNPVFTRGQLYGALSRVTSHDNVHVLIEMQDDITPGGYNKKRERKKRDRNKRSNIQPLPHRPSLLFMDLPYPSTRDSTSRNLAAGSVLELVKENNRYHIPSELCRGHDIRANGPRLATTFLSSLSFSTVN